LKRAAVQKNAGINLYSEGARPTDRTDLRPRRCTDLSIDQSVQPQGVPTVQVQQFRANLKTIFASDHPWLVGDAWRVKAIVVPVARSVTWRSQVDAKDRAKLRSLFEVALKSLVE